MIKKYKEILEEENLKGKDISDMLGMNYGSYRLATMPSGKTPKWVEVFIFAYNLGKLSKKRE